MEPPHYSTLGPQDAPPDRAALRRMLETAAAPVVASRLLFPGRFDHGFETLRARPAQGGAVSAPCALWFFGEALSLRVPTAVLRHRLSDRVAVEGRGMWLGQRFLDAGAWGDILQPLTSSAVHREMLDLARHGENFRDMPAYRRMVARAEAGRPMVHNTVVLSDRDVIDRYFTHYLQFLDGVREHGILSRKQARSSLGMGAVARVRRLYTEWVERDIGVAVTAEGRLVRFLSGSHRFAFACAAKVPDVPVEVRLVHVEWLAKQVAETGLPPHEAVIAGVRSLKLDPPKRPARKRPKPSGLPTAGGEVAEKRP